MIEDWTSDELPFADHNDLYEASFTTWDGQELMMFLGADHTVHVYALPDGRTAEFMDRIAQIPGLEADL